MPRFFLGQVSAPACLRLSEMTKRGDVPLERSPSEDGQDALIDVNPISATTNIPMVLGLQHPKLYRSWATFLQYLGDVDDSVDEVLVCLDWHSLGKATVVDVSLACISPKKANV